MDIQRIRDGMAELRRTFPQTSNWRDEPYLEGVDAGLASALAPFDLIDTSLDTAAVLADFQGRTSSLGKVSNRFEVGLCVGTELGRRFVLSKLEEEVSTTLEWL